MKFYMIALMGVLLISCGHQTENRITDKKDYDAYLVSKPSKTTSKYFEIWNSKIKPDSIQLMSFGIVGGEYNRYFKNTGDITYLKKAEKVLKRATDIAGIGRAGYYNALARNYISQHRFKEALQMADSAHATGGKKKDTQSLLFDVHMELGNYEKAEMYLDSIKSMSDFGYLIRQAKWSDYKGDLDTTIRMMEKAKNKAESSKNKTLMLWSYTNLADYYGHAGRIEDSYRHYLKSLALDDQNAYAKKGIAWIVFSYENNPKEALRILDSVTKNHKAPDYYLLKAEIAEYMNDEKSNLKNLDKYFKQVQNEDYGDMYNAYNIELYLNQTQQHEKAIKLAQKEVNNRPTPESYSLLAYSLLKNGEVAEAKKLVDTHVINKTFEPAIMYRVAEIYKAAGELEKVKQIKNELVEASYELGPLMAADITAL
ncbi:hypothetical protein FGM00_10030 [Aggregatimonas sangjinii]|uniref:Tetratricopeptide repeat protein n=1 Tax=Aggregatimonas sangjinii TaxID=2583587 RepID=A0A5B7SUU6_9FLAO|nr:hypothetical protein [Aggregatimonas sangjinii]QCX00434.1 hypothetical protein FGM00_10030 [Aggregatimonas sangjinii]